MSSTTQLIEGFLEQTVMVSTNDGRILKGRLSGFDPQCNIVLKNCQERIFSPEGVEVQDHGLFIVRGDNVSMIGEIDTDLDSSINWQDVRADPLLPIKH